VDPTHEEFSMKFVTFMNTPTGRSIRSAAGAALVVGGIAAGGRLGWSVAAFGMLPLVTGIADICPVTALSGRTGASCGRDDACG
jgi:hypothetical protein